MKAKIKPSKKQIERVSKEVYDMQIAVCDDNNAMWLEALNEEFGFGTDRLKRLINRFNKISDRYTEYMEDGYTEEEVRQIHNEALISLGIDPEQVYSGKNDYAQTMNNKRYTEKNHTPTLAEAAKAAEHMAAMKQFMNDNGKMNYLNTGAVSIN